MLKEVIENTKISYSLHFDESRKKKLVLIHGACCDSSVFLELSNKLLKKFNIMSIDLNGHGESGGEGFRGIMDHAFVCVSFWKIRTSGGGILWVILLVGRLP